MTADAQRLQMVLELPVMVRVRSFQRSMGLAYWLPSMALSITMGVVVVIVVENMKFYNGLLGTAIAFGLCGLGWFLRFFLLGSYCRGELNRLAPLVPWESLRYYVTDADDHVRLTALKQHFEGATSDLRRMDVVPMLIALGIILERTITVADRASARAVN